MHELARIIPDVNVLLDIPLEQLGEELLLVLQKRKFSRDMFMPANLIEELWPRTLLPGQQTQYPTEKRSEIENALGEAWAWLEREGFVIAAPDINGRNGWRLLSRKGRNFTRMPGSTGYDAARMLRKDMLHPRIAET